MHLARVFVVSAAFCTASALAQVPGPGVDAYPDQFTFCAEPRIPIGVFEARLPSLAIRPWQTEITVSNLAPRPHPPISGRPILVKAVRLSSNGIGDAPPGNGFGVAEGTEGVSSQVVMAQSTFAANPQRDKSGFSATTSCFDKFGNAVPIEGGGGACKIFVTFVPIPTAQSRVLQIATDDAQRPLITIPLRVSRAANCQRPVGHAPLPGVALGAFYPVGPVAGGVTQGPATISANCRCDALCSKGRQLLGTHVHCNNPGLSRCGDCCHEYADFVCDGSFGWSGRNWQ